MLIDCFKIQKVFLLNALLVYFPFHANFLQHRRVQTDEFTFMLDQRSKKIMEEQKRKLALADAAKIVMEANHDPH